MGTDSKKIQEELQFLLEDDSRVITYKFVSANFGIHVNEAKNHLQSLWSECQGRGDDDVTATYFVSGVCGEEEGCVLEKVAVVSADRLAAVRNTLTSVTSEHVYSLQRRRVCDTAVLFGADLQERQADPVTYNSHGAITDPRAEKVSEAELLKARHTAAPSQPNRRPAAPAAAPVTVKKEPPAGTDQKPSVASPASEKPANTNGRSGEASRENAEGAKAAAATGKGGATIASMFAKAGAEKKTKSPPKKAAGGGMMANFLQKGAERKPPATTPAVAPAPAPAAPQVSESPPVKKEQEAPVRFGAKKGSGGGGGGGGGRKRPRTTDGGGGPAKQRRRIQVLASDSEDSSEDDGDRSEPEPEPEPEPQPPCAALQSDEEEKSAPQSRRKRKLVNKTFVDDEGFMVTKKVYESCSGSDSEEPAAKPDPPAAEKSAPAAAPAPAPASAPSESTESAKRKETAPHKVKQAGIMSFFKKK